MNSPHYTDGPVTIWHGDCIDVMRQMPDNSVDAVVTDPPYGLEFMGKDWDSFKPSAAHAEARTRRADEMDDENKRRYIASGVNTYAAGRPFQAWCEEWAREAYRLLKPGGHLLAFGGTRTFHRLTAGIEDAGFEIRDSIAWLYGSGFPKSLDVPKAIDRQLGVGNTPASLHKREGFASSREQAYDVTGHGSDAAAAWNGWGTALKPAFEPIVVARKPLTGTVAANVLAYGTGALNIDGSRIGTEVLEPVTRGVSRIGTFEGADGNVTAERTGRWPANVVLDASQAAALDAQSGDRPGMAAGILRRGATTGRSIGGESAYGTAAPQEVQAGYGDSGGASRFFYTAKASTDERPSVDGIAHPTVKPVDLMRWLVKLVTPPGGVVLEPFAGSGTTVEAAVLEGLRCVAIEREGDYLPLILQRIRKPHAVGLDLDFDDPTPVPTPIRPAGGRTGPRRPAPAPHPGFDFGDDWELDA